MQIVKFIEECVMFIEKRVFCLVGKIFPNRLNMDLSQKLEPMLKRQFMEWKCIDSPVTNKFWAQ